MWYNNAWCVAASVWIEWAISFMQPFHLNLVSISLPYVMGINLPTIYLYIGIGGQPADISFIFKEETKDDLLTSSLFIKSHTDISQDKRTLSLKWILDTGGELK